MYGFGFRGEGLKFDLGVSAEVSSRASIVTTGYFPANLKPSTLNHMLIFKLARGAVG